IGRRAERIVVASEQWRAHDAETVDVEVQLGDRRLLGSVRGVRGDVVLTTTYSTVKAKHRLRAWVELLALSAASPRRQLTAVVVGRGPRDTTARITLGPVSASDAREHLATLLALRDAGLCTPLPLPVGAGEAYADARLSRHQKPEKARWPARKAWTSGYNHDGEDAELEHQLVWGGTVPFEVLEECELDDDPGSGWGSEPTAFGRLAMRLWVPLLEAEHQGTA
ncbi:MAG TPA: exodeoxyribonuclease V subunit gamma, partial [Mycobacteriales bacterium]|nr:exodeoxyribonuclease V subunit gamma [Mycobacteriales bacterium]